MKKIFVLLALVLCLGCSPDPADVTVNHQTVIDQTEGVDTYYNDPNCYAYCHAPGWEYITCHDGDGVNYIRVFVLRPNGPCGCDPDQWDCAYWNPGAP